MSLCNAPEVTACPLNVDWSEQAVVYTPNCTQANEIPSSARHHCWSEHSLVLQGQDTRKPMSSSMTKERGWMLLLLHACGCRCPHLQSLLWWTVFLQRAPAGHRLDVTQPHVIMVVGGRMTKIPHAVRMHWEYALGIQDRRFSWYIVLEGVKEMQQRHAASWRDAGSAALGPCWQAHARWWPDQHHPGCVSGSVAV